MKTKYIDSTAVIQVIGCIYKNPSLLDAEDKYTIVEDDFANEFHKVIFGTIYKLHELGGNNINLVTIGDFLSTRPKFQAIYQKDHGDEWLTKAAQVIQPENFDYYYNRLKKFTLLRAYDNCGIDVSFIYDPDNIFDTKKKQQQEEYLDNKTVVEISQVVDAKIEDIKLRYVDNDYAEAQQAGKDISNLIEELKQSPEVGVPLYGPLINAIVRGARLKKFYLRSAPSGYGKALPNDMWIPTPFEGYQQVGNIVKGDYIFGDDGKPVQVIGVYPQPEKKQVWEITFEDGRKIRCCKDHLWSYYKKDKKIYTETTEELYNKGAATGFKKFNRIMYRLPLTKPLEYNLHFDFPMEPYDYGRLAGSRVSCNNCRLNKYLYGTVEQRLDLFVGLMETGAENTSKGEWELRVLDENFKDDILQLAYELGFQAKSKLLRDKYKILIKCSKYIKPILQGRFPGKNISYRLQDLAIINIEPLEENVGMTCFTVDNKSHLFVAAAGIVTHNTRTMVADACYFSVPAIYEPDFLSWRELGICQPTLYITTEQKFDEIQTLCLSFISAVNEEHILMGEYVGDEEERVLTAGKMLSDAPLYIEYMPDFSLQDIENCIIRNVRQHNVTYVCFDYIQTSLRMLEEISSRTKGMSLREDNILLMLSIKLKDLCNKYGIFILSGTQLNGDWKVSETPDMNLLRGSKAVADKIDVGMHLLPVTKQDLDNLQQVIGLGEYDEPTLKLSIYKNRRGKYKSIYLWCKADLGICRLTPLFATTWDYRFLTIDDINISTYTEAF